MSHNRHLALMLLCCLIPIAAMAALFIFGASLNSWALIGLAVICPLTHALMMRALHRTTPIHPTDPDRIDE